MRSVASVQLYPLDERIVLPDLSVQLVTGAGNVSAAVSAPAITGTTPMMIKSPEFQLIPHRCIPFFSPRNSRRAVPVLDVVYTCLSEVIKHGRNLVLLAEFHAPYPDP